MQLVSARWMEKLSGSCRPVPSPLSLPVTWDVSLSGAERSYNNQTAGCWLGDGWVVGRKEGLSSRVRRGGRGRRGRSRTRSRRRRCLCRSSVVVLSSGIVTRQAPVWARQLGRDSRLGRERFGVSGTPWFLCESKTTAQLRWGPDGARIVAHLVRAPWQGVAIHGWAPKSRAGNASKAPGSVQKPPVGFDVRVVGRGSSGNLWREHRRCLGFGGWIQTYRGGAVKPDEASP